MSAKLASSSAVQTAIAGVVALLLLIAGAVAVDRFGGSNTSNRERHDRVVLPPAPAPAPTPEAPAVEIPVLGAETPAGSPVEPPASVRSSGRAPGVRTATPAEAGELAAPAPPPAERSPAGAASGPSPTPGPGANQPSPAPAEPPPPPAEPAPFLRVSASLGEGITGAVASLAVPEKTSPGNPQPDLDLTLGTTKVIGDAPPASDTSVEVSGSLLPGGVLPGAVAGGSLQT